MVDAAWESQESDEGKAEIQAGERRIRGLRSGRANSEGCPTLMSPLFIVVWIAAVLEDLPTAGPTLHPTDGAA
jgi:hypothetical protein